MDAPARPTSGSSVKTRRELVRSVAVVLTALVALLYFLIGLGVVTVLPDDPSSQTAFGLIAGGSFAIGAVIASRYDKRLLWALGTVGLAFVIWTYFNLAPERTPNFEVWGITIRVLQVPLLIALAYLAITPQTVDHAGDE